jgi:hypothetical protein
MNILDQFPIQVPEGFRIPPGTPLLERVDSAPGDPYEEAWLFVPSGYTEPLSVVERMVVRIGNEHSQDLSLTFEGKKRLIKVYRNLVDGLGEIVPPQIIWRPKSLFLLWHQPDGGRAELTLSMADSFKRAQVYPYFLKIVSADLFVETYTDSNLIQNRLEQLLKRDLQDVRQENVLNAYILQGVEPK